MNKLMYRFVATTEKRKKKKRRNRPLFRHGGIPHNKQAWESTLIKFTISHRIHVKLSISWVCHHEMLSEFKIISAAKIL